MTRSWYREDIFTTAVETVRAEQREHRDFNRGQREIMVREKQGGTALAELPKTKDDLRSALVKIEEIAQRHTLQALKPLGVFERALVLASGVTQLRQLVKPMVKQFLPLMGSALGFLCDRPNKSQGPYDEDTVGECLIEAVLRGVLPVDNQFNIISGRCYITKNGFRHLLRTFPGLTGLRVVLGVPRTLSGGAVVPARAAWKLDGKADQIEAEIPVRFLSGQGADLILGKAERKLLARVYAQVTGSEPDEAEIDDPPDALPRSSAAETLAHKVETEALPAPVATLPGNGRVTADRRQRLRDLTANWEEGAVDEMFESLGISPNEPPDAEQLERLLAYAESRTTGMGD